jgi:hypothetical protein
METLTTGDASGSFEVIFWVVMSEFCLRFDVLDYRRRGAMQGRVIGRIVRSHHLCAFIDLLTGARFTAEGPRSIWCGSVS